MASASSLRTKTFNVASDNVFCTYAKKLSQEETANGVISDPSIEKGFSKDFQSSRMTNTCSPTAVYNHPDESLYQETISTVERCMKRHSGDVMRFLEAISSRLSHLELYCYNVDKSVGEMRSNMGRDYEETDSKLKSLEKQLAEVSRSVQILRDKQELAETKKELAKLQLSQKGISSPIAPRLSVEQSPSPTSETSEVQNNHLAIVLRHQGTPQPHSPQIRTVEVPLPLAPSSHVPPQHVTQSQHYYVTSAPFTVQTQVSQGQYLASDAQYQSSQSLQQDISLVRLQPVPAHVIQHSQPQGHQFIQYQQRSQQPQQMLSSMQSSTQQPPTPAQSRPNSASSYPHHLSQQAPHEAVPGNGSIHMRTPFSNMSPQALTHADVIPNGYVGRQVQQQPPTQQIKTNIGAPSGNIYASVGQHQSFSPATYMMYRNEDATRQSPHQSQCSYPLANIPAQHPQHVSVVRNHSQPQFARNHPYNDQIEKLVNMGFSADHVLAVIQRLEESGQAVDFNVVLDTLNGQSSGLHRGWTEFEVKNDTEWCYEASFLSLNLNTLNKQLAKLDLAQRLFIEPDVLPLELRPHKSELKDDRREPFQNSVENKPSQTDPEFPQPPIKDESVLKEVVVASAQVDDNDDDDMDDACLSGLKYKGQVKVNILPDTSKRDSSFEASQAEAELDMLLESLGETDIQYSSHIPSVQQQSLTAIQTSNTAAGFDDAIDDLLRLNSRSKLTASGIDDEIDNLLNSTSNTKKKTVCALDDGIDDLLDSASHMDHTRQNTRVQQYSEYSC